MADTTFEIRIRNSEFSARTSNFELLFSAICHLPSAICSNHAVHADLALRYLLAIPSGRTEIESMPTIILMHGRGADAHDLFDLAPMLDVAPGCRFILPNAPRAWEAAPGMTFGFTWFDGWPPEPESVAASRDTLLTFIDEVKERYPTSALILAGFSQGAMMSLEVGLRADVAAIIAMSGGLYEPHLPDQTSPRPVFIAHGTMDDVVPVSYGRRARLLLEERGFDVDYHEYPMGHQIVMEEIEAVRTFLARLIGS
jgi:phospholipase/carboxylesterase